MNAFRFNRSLAIKVNMDEMLCPEVPTYRMSDIEEANHSLVIRQHASLGFLPGSSTSLLSVAKRPPVWVTPMGSLHMTNILHFNHLTLQLSSTQFLNIF